MEEVLGHFQKILLIINVFFNFKGGGICKLIKKIGYNFYKTMFYTIMFEIYL